MDTSVSDGCTGIPDIVFGVDISRCCKEHDTVKPCSMRSFFKCLKGKIGTTMSILITLGGSIGCIWKYPRFMWRKI